MTGPQDARARRTVLLRRQLLLAVRREQLRDVREAPGRAARPAEPAPTDQPEQRR